MIQTAPKLDPLDILNWDVVPVGPDSDASVSVFRVKTSYWKSSRGLHARKDITLLKKLSSGYQILQEDSDTIGADKVMERIVNLNEVEDGLYEVILVNQTYEWEKGHIDDYDYELVPYRP